MNITNNKKIRKVFKPLPSDKSINDDKIHVNENGELILSLINIEVLNNFFLNIVRI